jgi:penicillin amidase
MKRWILRISAASAFLIAVVLLVVWLGLRASLPTLDGTIETAGLDAVATIERDAAGIPTITAATRTDLAFATGFAHGQDRFFQMDLTRRQAAGELSELIGSALVEALAEAKTTEEACAVATAFVAPVRESLDNMA